MKTKKRLSLFLAFCMLLTVFSGLSLPAFAEGETWTDVGAIEALRTAAATDGAYIRLTADITFSDGRAVDVPADTAVVLDLNGHTVSRGLTGINASSGRYSNCFTVEGKLTIEDSSGDDSGRITGGYCTMHGGGINVTGGELILNGGSVCDNVVSPSSGVGGGIYVNNGSFTMNGGLIYDNSAGSGDSSTNGRGGGVGLIRSTFTMNGGRIFSCGVRTGQYNVNRNSSSANGGAVFVGIDSTFTMTGGQLGGLLDLSANQGLDNQASKAGAAVYVNGYSESSDGSVYPAGTFHMTGGTIKGSYCTGTPGGAVYVGDRAEFTMSGDSTIQNGQGDSVYVDKGGIFEMSAGLITKNKNSTVRVNGTFNMTGGSITENAATFGGGVFVGANGRFTISGSALISANSASSAGGGVYLKVPTDNDPEYYGGVFTMNGGTISDNKVIYYSRSASLGNGDGGGVWIGNTCTFNMTGGTITGNHSAHLIYHDEAEYNSSTWHVGLGGVFVNDTATFNLSGPSRIYGNVIGDKPLSIAPRVESDVVLGGRARINVTGDLTGAYVGLMHSVENQPSAYIEGYDSNDDFKESEVMTAGYDTYNPDVHPMAYFFPNVEGFAVVDDNGQAKVQRHVHAFTETLNDAGDTLTVACTGCDLSTELKISAVGGQYTGEPYPATLAIRPEMRMVADEAPDAEGIEYLKDGVLLTGAPVEVGNYTARFPVPIGGVRYTVTVDYAVTAPAHDCVWEFRGFTWTDDPTSPVGRAATANYACTVAGCGNTTTVPAEIAPASLPAAKCFETQTVTLTATVSATASPDGEAHSGTDTVTVGAIGSHDFDDSIEANVTTQAATCTVNGFKKVKCSRCEEVQTTTLYAPGSHDFDETIEANVTTQAATCTVDGFKKVKCSRCEEVQTTTLYAPGSHDFDETIAENVTVVAATCTAAGSKTVKCSRCDETKRTSIKALGHDWGNWVVVTPATETEEGLERCTCARCGKTMDRVIPVGGEETPEFCGTSNFRALIEAFRNIFRTILSWFRKAC